MQETINLKQDVKKIIVFTDGACSNNGKKNAKCGYGVYFPNKELKHISRKFTHGEPTNQRAELYAIYKALRRVTEHFNFEELIIYTDSQYSINCVTEWIHGWKKNAVGGVWLTSKKEPVLNRDLIELIDMFLNKKTYKSKIKFIHVDSHQNPEDISDPELKQLAINNNNADYLARRGLQLE